MAKAQTQTKKLARFTVSRVDQGFQLHIEDDSGETLELTATQEQADLIADTLDELLDEDDSADEILDDDDDDDDEHGEGDEGEESPAPSRGKRTGPGR